MSGSSLPYHRHVLLDLNFVFQHAKQIEIEDKNNSGVFWERPLSVEVKARDRKGVEVNIKKFSEEFIMAFHLAVDWVAQSV